MCSLDRLPATESAEAAWSLVLEGLEADLAGLYRYAADSEVLFELPTGWEAPAAIGPLPESLNERAQAVFGQMQQMSAMLAERRDETARQMRAVDSVPRVETDTSLYLDVVG